VKAVVYRAPLEMRVDTRPEPRLGDGEVRVDVIATGLCGTDVRIFKGEHRAAALGRVPGHEIIARVSLANGSLPEGLVLGDIVMVAPNIGCGTCRWCGRGQENLCVQPEALGITLDGGFADSMVVPAGAVSRGNLIRLAGADADADAWVHATLAEPLACVVRGHRRIKIKPGESVLVGGGGPVGLLHIALAKAQGAAIVVCSDPNAARRDAAVRAGATHTLDPANQDVPAMVAEFTGGQGIDAVITAAPVHQLQSEALEIAATGGRVLFFGGLPKSRPTVELDTNLIHYKELTVCGTSASTVEDCRVAVGLITSGVVDTSWMVSHAYSLDHFATAVERVQNSTALKVVVTPTDISISAPVGGN